MTTQDKGATIENPVAEISKFLANAPKLFADEIARLRKENEALRAAADTAMAACNKARRVIVCLTLQFADRHENGDFSAPKAGPREDAFNFLGWPNPCPKDQAK